MPADAAGPLADHENFSLFQSFGYAGGKLVAARSDGLIACVDVATGHPVWQQKLDARAGLPIAMNYSWVVYPCNMPGGGGGGLCVLDAETGGLVRLIDTDDERQIERLFLTLSGQIVAVTVQTIVAFDPRSGQKLWSYAADALPAAGGAALVPSTAEPDLDGLYFYVGAAGRREFAGSIRKIGFDDGRVLWTSEPLVARPEEGITTALVAAQLLVAGGRFVTALDAIDGRTLWEGTVDKESIYRRRFVTERYLIALHEPPERRPGTITAYFYDYRQRSGAIPAKIGVINLGELTEVQLITVRDDALLVQSGKTLHAWTHTP
jgi:outer membrane protein assembly factor BamB